MKGAGPSPALRGVRTPLGTTVPEEPGRESQACCNLHSPNQGQPAKLTGPQVCGAISTALGMIQACLPRGQKVAGDKTDTDASKAFRVKTTSFQNLALQLTQNSKYI